jgi:hypothetical protein
VRSHLIHTKCNIIPIKLSLAKLIKRSKTRKEKKNTFKEKVMGKKSMIR